METDTLTKLGDQNDVLTIICQFYFNKTVIFTQIDGCKTRLTDIFIICDLRLFHNTILGSHKKILAV